jgi:hypothetical protein
MSPELITRLRWFLFAVLVVQVLSATVLCRPIWERLLAPMLELAERRQPAPALVRSSGFWRTIALIGTVPALLGWWYLGTTAGVAFLQTINPRG